MADTQLADRRPERGGPPRRRRHRADPDHAPGPGHSLQGASGGFKGGAAGGLADALEAWFTAAGDLLPTLQEYATKLVAVDEAEARTEAGQQESYSRLADRLGGTQ